MPFWGGRWPEDTGIPTMHHASYLDAHRLSLSLSLCMCLSLVLVVGLSACMYAGLLKKVVDPISSCFWLSVMMHYID